MLEKYLVINAGSSSLKFGLYEMPTEKLIANGLIGRIGLSLSDWKLVRKDTKFSGEMHIADHSSAFDLMKNCLLESKTINSLDEIKGVGHRVLHGGTYYNKSAVIDPLVVSRIEELTPLGPIHHPGELKGIEAARKSFPNALMTATFDTSFHQTLPEENYMFPTPYSYYEEYGVRKYGFHGTSHQYITEKMQEKLGRNEVNLIICHIGSGASITAVKDGKSFDTTMGLTPNAGLMMCTRGGTFDPSVLEYVCKVSGKSISEVMEDLNKNSGLLGVSGVSSDYRDVEEASKENDRAKLAINMLVRSAVNYIVSFYNELEGKVDGIIFTAGIGENSSEYRRMVLSKCAYTMPIVLDNAKNQKIAGFKEENEGIITTPESSIPVYVIPTNEELMIARENYNLNHEKVKTYKK